MKSMQKTITLLSRFLSLVLFVLILHLVSSASDAIGGMWGWGTAGTALSTFETADFAGSGVCAFCHSSLKDSAGNDVSIDSHWRSTMMANSAKDPLWQAKISSEVKRNPSLQAVIEEKCSRCHMGMARYQAITDGTPMAVLGDGFLNPGNPLHDAAMDGVSCTLCHQIRNAGLDTPASFTGLYFIDTYTSPPGRLAFGPYSQPLKNPMEMHSGFSPAAGYHISDSALCGVCHTVYTPTVDEAGNVIGEFPEQTTYLEWRHSEWSKTCQECHLTAASGPVVISNRPRMLSPRQPFGMHELVGGNSMMVTLLKENASQLGITADVAQLNATIERTNVQLTNRTAALKLTAASVSQDALELILQIRNLTGHKLPTGIPCRRVWLHLTVTDAAGKMLFESGKPLPDGSIAGNDADLGAGFEPHYDLITDPGQVQIYESVMADNKNEITYTLLRGMNYAKDNRLLPFGFDKTTASADIAVRGAAADDKNFTAGQDQILYRVAMDGSRRPLTVSAELLYQAVSYPFIQDLRQEDTDLTRRFLKLYDGENKAVSILSGLKSSVQ